MWLFLRDVFLSECLFFYRQLENLDAKMCVDQGPVPGHTPIAYHCYYYGPQVRGAGSQEQSFSLLSVVFNDCLLFFLFSLRSHIIVEMVNSTLEALSPTSTTTTDV